MVKGDAGNEPNEWVRAMKGKPCYNCGHVVDRDVIALNKKMLGHHTKRFLCITCLSEYLGYTVSDLENLITEFKEQGCALFLGEDSGRS